MSTITLVTPEAQEAYLRVVCMTAEGCERPSGEDFEELLYGASKDVRDFKRDVALIQRRVEWSDQLAELPALQSKSLQVQATVLGFRDDIAKLNGSEFDRRLERLKQEIAAEVQQVKEKIEAYRQDAGEYDISASLAEAKQARSRLAETADPALAHELQDLHSAPIGPNDFIYRRAKLQDVVHDRTERRVGESGYRETVVVSRGTAHWRTAIAGFKATIQRDSGEFVARAKSKLSEAERALESCLAAEREIAEMDAEHAAATAKRDERIAELEAALVDPHQAAIDFPAA